MLILPLYLILTTSYLILATPVSAQCPICVVTVGGGMLIAKKLGVDDFLVSIWISALNTALSFWLSTKIKQKYLNNPWLLSILMLVLTLAYFISVGQTGHPSNKLLGIDKIIFGQTLGMLVMFAGNYLYSYTKSRNDNKAIFPYSKVVFPVGLVLLTTLVFKLIFRL